MVAPTFDVSKSSRGTAGRAVRADGERLRYRLDVLAASAEDVVQSAGGWLYDRVMAGWQVTAMLPRGSDTQSLRILGVSVSNVQPWFDGAVAAGQSLAVSAEAFTADARVRARVLEALDDQLTEVALWGQSWPLGVHRATSKAQHVLSAAARTFKSHALAAAGFACPAVDPTEALLCDVRSPMVSEPIRLD